MFSDRMRFSVIEANTNKILTRDLEVKEHQVIVNLSAPSVLSMKIDQGQRYASAAGIEWKNYGHIIVPEIETDTHGRVVLGAQLVTNHDPDPESGDMVIDGTGFMGYPKGIPWLENLNPIAIDPAELFQRVWAHIQSFPNANLGVDVQPSSTGTQMLPGYGFDGSILSFDFFAVFIRAIDFNDCGDFLSSLARDLPLDLFEEATWNENRTELNKVVKIAYPLGGVVQENLSFRLGDNVINAQKASELDIEPVSDVIIRSWLPGKVYTSQLSNADMTRFRRVILEEDANITSTERAAAWAKRKLQRRNVPKHFDKITVDPNHPNAPFGSWGVGDSIYVQAPNYSWYGDINLWHRIMSYTIKSDSPLIEIGLKAEGAFNYDPIDYDPEGEITPPVDPNLLSNGYFARSLAGWYPIRGQWFRVATAGYSGEGCVRVDCDDDGEEFESEKIQVIPGETINLQAAVRYQEIDQDEGAPYTFGIAVNTFINGGSVVRGTMVDSFTHDGTGPYTPMSAEFVVPETGVNEVSLSFKVHNSVNGGISFWDDARILR